MGEMVRVLIAEDHPMMREAIVARLLLDGNITVVGEASDGNELLDLYDEHRPDVVLVDVQMPGLSGVEATKVIKEKDPEARIIILSASSDRAAISSALSAGASGYLLKSVDGAQLNAYVHQAAEGRAVFDAGSAMKVIEGLQPATSRISGASLSTREVEVLSALAEGLTYQEIADNMSISMSSVRTYVKRLFDKLGVSDRAAAVRQGMRAGIIS
ncbi:MAG: response regulator transcription factor [Actinobacteria bacterium]|nr:response regulator transcription factor [Actinomycetota bacterium]